MVTRTAWRAAGIVGTIACAMACPVGPAWGQGRDGPPSGRFGIATGVRQGVGQLGDDFGLGVMGSIEAGFHPTSLDRKLSVGLSWSVAWGWFGPDDQASVTGSLKLLEFNMGPRLRRLIGEDTLRFLAFGAGATLLRSNVPISPDNERMYLGPYASLGVEQFIGSSMILYFEARYGLIVNGPGSLSISLGVAWGR